MAARAFKLEGFNGRAVTELERLQKPSIVPPGLAVGVFRLSRHCAALRAGLITAAAPRLNDASLSRRLSVAVIEMCMPDITNNAASLLKSGEQIPHPARAAGIRDDAGIQRSQERLSTQLSHLTNALGD